MRKFIDIRHVWALSPKQIKPFLYQMLMVGLLIGGAYFLFISTQENLEARHIESGFSFLSQEAGFPIGDSLISYSPSDSYGQAFLVGIINTVYVAIICVILATLVGIVIGIAQVSGNPLVSKMAEVYVEVLRNIPVLLILLFVYGVVLIGLPSVRDAIEFFPGGFLSQRGIYIPRPSAGNNFSILIISILFGVITTVIFLYWAKKTLNETGKNYPTIWISIVLLVLPPIVINSLIGNTLIWEVPELKGFNFKGGWVFRPEFAALVIGLVLYRGAFIAENVRSGIMSVQKGQIEAANALGIPANRTMRDCFAPSVESHNSCHNE
jgi:general L-amino acid transport system permease protein